jgi:hypothetical protein
MFRRIISAFFFTFCFLIPLFSFDMIGSSAYIENSLDYGDYGFFDSVQSFSFNKLENKDTGITYSSALLGTSYNTKYQHGFNDESLWQGKGLNTYFTGGSVLEYGDFSFIFFPEVWFSENRAFEIVLPHASQENPFAFYLNGIDNPQRYGDEPVFFYGPGQSEIRYTGEKFTAGIGTQSLWLGPGKYNSLILSNNGGGFPKIDLGFRDLNTSIGVFELFVWWGMLSESEYFDSVSSNDNNLFTGIHIAYSPTCIEGFTLGINRTLTANLSEAGISSYGTLFVPFMTTMFGKDLNDQRASITLEWNFPSVGFTTYAEWARNDYQPSVRSILQFPQRTEAYTVGVSQILQSEEKKKIVATLEITNLLVSWDYTINAVSLPSFYTHGIVTQGYTQNGQILGAGIGTGSNSQIFNVDFFLDQTFLRLFVQRVGISPDYLFSLPYDSVERSSSNNNAELTAGVDYEYTFHELHTLMLGLEISRNLNWNYIAGNDVNNVYLHAGYRISF